jgi:hypothetical protein
LKALELAQAVVTSGSEHRPVTLEVEDLSLADQRG